MSAFLESNLDLDLNNCVYDFIITDFLLTVKREIIISVNVIYIVDYFLGLHEVTPQLLRYFKK